MSRLWLIGLAASAAWTSAAIAQGAPPPPAPPPPMVHGAHAPGVPMMHPGMPGPMSPMNGIHRFGRGNVVPPQFRGGQFVVQDWQAFGFPPPMPGGQWIRHYDDALLIDGDGRVMDERYGWDWDRHGDGDMAYGGYDEGYGHGGPPDCRHSCTRVRHLPPPPPRPAYGYGYGGGCGCGGATITETTTTTAPVVETRTYYDTVYETVYEHRAAPRRHYSKPVRRFVKTAPRPGERG
jgi:hypothetical protein